MAKIDGNYMRIKVGTVTLSSTNSVDFTVKKDYQKTTTQDSGGWEELHQYAGVKQLTGSFDGMYDVAGTYSVEDVISNIINNEGTVTIEVGETATGGTYYSFTGAINDCTVSAKNDSIPTFKGSFQSSGQVTQQTVGAS